MLPEQLRGVLTLEEISSMNDAATHTPLYCTRKMRDAITRALLLATRALLLAGTYTRPLFSST